MSYNPGKGIALKNTLLELLRTESIDGRGQIALTDKGPTIRIAVPGPHLSRAHQLLPFRLGDFEVAVSDSL